MPKVALIGDSIRLGYAPLVAKKLVGQVEIFSPDANGEDSKNILKNLETWAIANKPTIIHLNCGLHDLKKSKANGTYQISREKYEENLREIANRLKGTRLIFASTTPIIDERHARRKANFDRFEADVKSYNQIATKVMNEADVAINDLHQLIEFHGPEKLLLADGTHYNARGYELLADAVADSIRRELAIATSVPSRLLSPDKKAGDDYHNNEKALDALVPEFFKNLKAPEFAIPKDAEEWRSRRDGVRKAVIGSLGELPDRPKTPKVRTVCFEDHRDYRLEKVFINNEAGNEIPLLMIIPKNLTKPAPTIFWLHSSGHDTSDLLTPNQNGGKEPLGIVLAKKGYVVLGTDNWWHGERAGTGPGGNREKANDEQQSLHKLNQLLGRTLWGMFVRDDQIAMDYLCSRREVDAKRIGVTGRSMGSTRAWWLAAVDDRVACCVGVACLTRYSNLIAHGQLRQHGVYYFPYGLMKHFDTEGVISLIAPRPCLLLTGDLDGGSPADGIKTIEQKVTGVYQSLSAQTQFKNILYENIGHTHTQQMREETLQWFDRWLKK